MDNNVRRSLTSTEWLICVMAVIGFAFDIYAILTLPLIIGPALREMAGIRPGTPEFNYWFGLLFYVPAVAGGFFGLVGGYLTDRFGRRKVLVVSILLYAFGALFGGFSSTPMELLFYRTLVFVGVCVEFVAAVAWLAELFPDHRQRETVLGYTQAFSSIGGLMVAGVNYVCVTYASSFPAVHGGHEAWRYTLISGVIPAIPLIIIRPFLPESPAWKEKHEKGTLKRPSIGELFAPTYRKTTIVTALMFACSYGAAFGAIQQLPQIVRSLPEVAQLARPLQDKIVPTVQTFQEIGGLIGRVILAYLAVRIVSRQKLIRTFQIPGLLLMPAVFFFAHTYGLEFLKWGAVIAGLATVAQFSFWGNYLPTVYPVHLRGTGESFAANVGGRMIGTSFAAVTPMLSTIMPGANPGVKLATAAAAVALFVYAVGLLLSYSLAEPGQKKLQE
ncbi:MAG: MFS transporter [Acidobacteria bacterium]|nr:MFS transporter [Acidobacteriota bacterium]